MNTLTFNKFCHGCCDGLYDPSVPLDSQCSGYLKLKEMVVNNITPASLEEIKRWETNPTQEELDFKPELKYLTFLHPLTRLYIIEKWDLIKTLKIE